MPLLEVDPVADPVLLDGDPGRELRAGHEPAGEVLLEGDPLVDADPEVPRPQVPRAELEDRADPLVHAQAEDLDREDVVEPVGDQAGEAVPLGVDHAVGVGLLVQSPGSSVRSSTAWETLRSQNSGPGGSASRVSSRRLIWERGFQSP